MPQRGRFLEEGRPARRRLLLARHRTVTRPARLPAVTPLTRTGLTTVVTYGPSTAAERGLVPIAGPQPRTVVRPELTPALGSALSTPTEPRITLVVEIAPRTVVRPELTPTLGSGLSTHAEPRITLVVEIAPRTVVGLVGCGVGLLAVGAGVGTRPFEVIVGHRAEPQRLLPR
ncbi:hypothetical protein ACIBP6_05695 [Nonomuraea terrae]|uniref:hypothetical protein n=1 Tax=Nonomuraea terrae TaxID=2530383 RepID=UPI0037AAF722